LRLLARTGGRKQSIFELLRIPAEKVLSPLVKVTARVIAGVFNQAQRAHLIQAFLLLGLGRVQCRRVDRLRRVSGCVVVAKIGTVGLRVEVGPRTVAVGGVCDGLADGAAYLSSKLLHLLLE